jgi:hypothetical protein
MLLQLPLYIQLHPPFFSQLNRFIGLRKGKERSLGEDYQDLAYLPNCCCYSFCPRIYESAVDHIPVLNIL